MKKILCMLLSVLLVLTMMPTMAFAEGAESAGGNSQSTEKRLVFSDEGNLSAGDENVEKQLEMNFDIGDKETVTKYLYVATYAIDNGSSKLTILEPVSESAALNVRYLVGVTDNMPEFDETDGGLTFESLGGNQYKIACDFNKSSHLKKGEGTFDYDVSLPDIGNANITAVELAQVSPNQEYDLYLDILGYGQGNGLTFNNDLTSWKTCFYVVNRDNNYDARYLQGSDHGRYRTYIGKPGEFVIEAKAQDGGGWQSIDTLDEKYRIFSLTYVGREYEYSPVFKIDYDLDRDNQYEGTSIYEYRVRYTGNDPYLNNDQRQHNGFSIPLIRDEDLPDFELQEEWCYDDEEEYTTGNVLHFDSIGMKIRMKLVITPSVIQGGGNNDGSGESKNIYIKNEASNIRFLRYTGENSVQELSADESPFTVVWDPSNEEYIVTYDHPERDLYGPGYILMYAGDFQSKIREEYNYPEDTEITASIFSDVYTAKLTTAQKDFLGGTVDATTESEINTTEVVFNQNAAGNASELTVNTNDANVILGGGLVDNMKTANQTNDVSLLVRNVQEEPYYLTDAQRNIVRSLDKALDFRVQSKNGTQDSAINFGTDGYAQISIPCSETDPAVYYINDEGQKEEVPCAYDNGKVTFTAKHFSVYGIGKGTGGSSSSGSGGSGVVPPVSQDNVTNSGTAGTDNAATSADISASVSADGKAKAEVNQATADKIVDKAAANQSAEVIIDATTESGKADATTVTLPTDTVQKLVEKTDAEITVKSDSGTVTMDQKAAETVAKEAAGTQIAIIVEKTRDEKTKMEFELKIVSGGKVIGEFKSGKVKVTVKLNTALDTLKDAKLTCVYIDDNGIYTKIGGKKNSDGTYTFATTHFSSYAVMAETEADEIIDEQAIETVKNTKLVARSKNVKLKSGKKAIKVFWYAKEGGKLAFDGYEVYRSTKKNKGYGKKPFFTTKKTSYTNTKQLKKGTRYYYKVRGFKLVDGKKVYTPYSLKAIRAMI